MADANRGLYGLALPDLTSDGGLLVGAPAHWRSWRVVRRHGGADAVDGSVGPDCARLRLAPEGSLVIDRQSRTSTFTMHNPPSDAELAHPYLSATAAIAARWEGWQSFHAGAFVVGEAVWGILGEREVGKSSLLAALAALGADVMTDDLLVLREGKVLAGPRCIDLREGSARALGAGVTIGSVGTRERWRLKLDPVAPELPLAGWITLEWGEDESFHQVAPGERFLRLVDNLTVVLEPPDPPTVLELASLPMVTLRRPRRLDTLARTAESLVTHLGGR
ncbi:MAG TPA: hypothetical protein VGI50_10300 [Solirubrobacteraceae bacterium]|jgi:hypothetical protein